MRSADQIKIVLLVKLAHYVFSECEADTSIVIAIGIDTSLGVRPKQVAKKTSIRHISWTHNVFDLIQVLELGTQTSVHTENFLINDRCHGKAIKDIAEHAPKSDRESALALIVKAINSVDLGTLVVSSQQEEVLRVLDFVAEQKTDCFNGLLSSIDVIAQEEIVGLGWESSVLENT